MASPRVVASASSTSSGLSRQPSSAAFAGSLNMDDVWRDDVSVSSMTLEDFLARADAEDDDDGDEEVHGPSSNNNMDMENNQVSEFRNESFGHKPMRGSGKGRGRKRLADIDPADRAAIQRQKRMIKNRESAARSRERKQAYTAELETLVMRLEEEHAVLLKHHEEQHNQRLKQIIETVIPITKERKPRTALRRTHSEELPKTEAF